MLELFKRLKAQLFNEEHKQMEQIIKIGWYAVLIAVTGDLLVSYILSLFYKEYSNLKMSISALGNPQSPVRVQFNCWMLIEGILLLISLPAFYNRYHSVSDWITVMIIVFIVLFAVGACIFTSFSA